jgi:type II secretory pathway pseudopilin PulG
MQKINKGNGFSMLELMIAGAVMSFLILGYMRFMKSRIADAKYIESMSESENMLNNLKFYFLDKDACMKTLSSITVPSDHTSAANVSMVKSRADKVIYDFSDLPSGFTKGVDSTGTANANVIQLNKVEIFNPSNIGAESYGQLDVVVTFLRDVKRTNGTESFKRKFQISVGTDANMKVAKCFSSTENAIESAYKLVCKDAGGEFNTATGECDFYPLVNGQNSKVQCQNIGGLLFPVGNRYLCRISSSVEVSRNWTPYLEWSSTISRSPSDSDCDNKDTTVKASNITDVSANPNKYKSFPATVTDMGNCPTGGHSWSDKEVEECEFTCTEKAPCVDTTCRTVTREIKSQVTERGYY